MGSSVLFDGRNFSLASGTGIATYTKTLVKTATGLGFSGSILLSSNAGYDKRDPLFSEVALFDPIIAKHPSPKIRLQTLLTQFIGAPWGVRPSNFGRLSGTVRSSSHDFSVFDRTYAAPNVFERARLHFRRHRTCVQVRLDDRPDLFHATSPMPIVIKNACNIYTIHDLIPLLLPFTTLDDKKYMIELLRTLCRNADHIVTVSESSRRDIIRVLDVPESRITNTYQCVDLPEDPPRSDEDGKSLDIEKAFGVAPGEYYVFVGAIEPKKNLRRLIDAYAISGSKRPLLIIGGLGWEYEADLKKITEDRFSRFAFDGQHLRPERTVRHLSYLPKPQLVSLVRDARALFFPSLYEGFGLPVLEAMQLGTAVLSADNSSLPEIVGDAGLLVNAHDEIAIASAIRTLDQDNDLVGTLVANGYVRARLFSSEAYAARLADLYRGLGVHPRDPHYGARLGTAARPAQGGASDRL